jgi:hypothetical protein
MHNQNFDSTEMANLVFGVLVLTLQNGFNLKNTAQPNLLKHLEDLLYIYVKCCTLQSV